MPQQPLLFPVPPSLGPITSPAPCRVHAWPAARVKERNRAGRLGVLQTTRSRELPLARCGLVLGGGGDPKSGRKGPRPVLLGPLVLGGTGLVPSHVAGPLLGLRMMFLQLPDQRTTGLETDNRNVSFPVLEATSPTSRGQGLRFPWGLWGRVLPACRVWCRSPWAVATPCGLHHLDRASPRLSLIRTLVTGCGATLIWMTSSPGRSEAAGPGFGPDLSPAPSRPWRSCS